MAGRSKGSKTPSKAQQNKEFFEALRMFEEERGIPVEYMIEKITAAITVAVKNSNGGNDDVTVDINSEKNVFNVFLNKTVVEEVEDHNREMLVEEARLYTPAAIVGDKVGIPLETKEFGRIAAVTAKHVIRQGIREVERGQVAAELQSRNQELVAATVERIDERNGTVILKIGKIEVPLLKNEQIANETFTVGDTVKVYVVDIKEGEKGGTRATVSRTHPGLVKRLFETEVPEIYDGTVEIKGVSREAGSRTKIAVFSHDENVDPVGACIGPRSSRVNGIVKELCGEKIDIVKYSEDPAEFISKALSPANVVSVEIDEEQQRCCRVRVPDEQLSLAIGNKGQNARLAARLTGWKIDIRPESGYYGEENQE
ncbi:MAG: transcription termination/antitermination protein NusA [Clostridia bacterium]|nr:transcription termination/antitermination protein NusA [Oscillospiraceae bacterium]MBQ6797531.1 transcription termination/antitermination protein NusA [Clostridia bacterium]